MSHDKRDTTLNLNEGCYLNYLKESMPGRQHKTLPPEEKKDDKKEKVE